MHYSRRQFLSVLGLGTAAVISGNLSTCSRIAEKPNIIYILADDLGYGDLGCYGQKEIKTPNLDTLAAEGLKFTDHYAGSTVCAPSRCCLMTGLHTGHARFRGNAKISLTPEDVTIPELLKPRGYTTGLIGKWGLGDVGTSGHPNKKGFDYFFVYLNQTRAHNYYTDYLWRNDEKVMLQNEVVFETKGYAAGIGSAATKKKDYSHDLMTQEALTFIETNKQQPFFLYLAYTIPHANNQANLINEHGMEVPDYGEYKNKDWPDVQKGQAAMISRMDRDIGTLVALLKKYGLAENTLIMFSSDNGPHNEGGFGYDPEFNNSNGPLRGIKRDLYEGGIRVPMIAWWPGTISPGGVTDHISAFWDVLPTCTELAGAATPDNIDGISFVPTLMGNPASQKQHDYLYWEFHWGRPTRMAIRKDQWKAVKDAPDAAIELYDVKTDIGERTDVAEQHPDVVVEMEKIFTSARTESGRFQLKYRKSETS